MTKISSIFQFWFSLYKRGPFAPEHASVHTHGSLLEVCFGKTFSDLLTNHLNWAQARASLLVWVTVLMSSFHAVLWRLARWRCRFTVLLLQICVSAYMCRIKLPIEGRRAIHTEGGNAPLRGKNRQSPASKKSVWNCFEEMTWSGQLRPPSLSVSGSLDSESPNHPSCLLWNEFYFMWFQNLLLNRSSTLNTIPHHQQHKECAPMK